MEIAGQQVPPMNPAAAQAAAEQANRAAAAQAAAQAQQGQSAQEEEPIRPLRIPEGATIPDTLTAIAARMDDVATSRANAARLYDIHERLFASYKEAMSIWAR